MINTESGKAARKARAYYKAKAATKHHKLSLTNAELRRLRECMEAAEDGNTHFNKSVHKSLMHKIQHVGKRNA